MVNKINRNGIKILFIILIVLGISLFCLGISSATVNYYTENTSGVFTSGANTENEYIGVKIKALNNATIINATCYNGNTLKPTHLRFYDAGKTPLLTVTINAEYMGFINYSIVKDTIYYIGCTRNTSGGSTSWGGYVNPPNLAPAVNSGNLNWSEGFYQNIVSTDFYQRGIIYIGLTNGTAPPPTPSPVITFVTPSIANNTVQFYTNNSVQINTTITDFGGAITTTKNIYSLNGTLVQTNISTLVNESVTFTGLAIGQYYLNATATNGTITNYTETRRFTIYNISVGNITTPTINQSMTRYLNVTWLNSTTTNNSVAISSYTVFLLNSDLSTNVTLNVTTGNYFLFDTYLYNLSIGAYFIKVMSTDTKGYTANITQSINIISNAQLNITAYDYTTNATITTGIYVNITNINLSTSTIINSTGIYATAQILKGYTYNITYNMSNYAIFQIQYIANSSSFQLVNTSLFKENSVLVIIRDEATSALLSGTNCTVTFTGTTIATYYNTTTGLLFVSNITADAYTVTFDCLTYAQRQYFITVTNRSTQTLSAFLTTSAINVLLSYTDKDTAIALEGVNVALAKMINGTLTVVENRLSDVTGRTQFTVASTGAYTFTNVLTGYTTKVFTLNPVLFTSYNVQLAKSTTTTQPLDFQSIAVTYYPTSFVIGNNTFTWGISSPNGTLETFGYNLTTYCKNITNYNGTDSKGGINVTLFNLSCAQNYDSVKLFYWYVLNTGDYRNFTVNMGIAESVGNTSTVSKTLNSETYGMGLFERILISTIVSIVLMGVVGMIGGVVPSLVVGLFIQGYLVSTGFIPIASVIITLFAGVLLIMSYQQR